MRIISKIKRYLLSLYDSVASNSVRVGLGDVLLPRGRITYLQMIAIGRYLDIIDYCDNGNESFTVKNEIGKAIRNDFDAEAGDNKFVNLIASYKAAGYDENSKILINKKFDIINGTHRLAMHLYLRIPYINTLVQIRAGKNSEYSDKLFKNGVSTSTLIRLEKGRDMVIDRLADMGQCFTIVIIGEMYNDKISLSEDIRMVSYVIKEFHSASANANPQITLYQAWIDRPEYYIDGNNYYSKRAIEIESILKKRIAVAQLNADIEVSKSCLEGSKLFFSIKDGLVEKSRNIKQTI